MKFSFPEYNGLRFSFQGALIGGFIFWLGPIVAVAINLHDNLFVGIIIGAAFSAVPGFLIGAVCSNFESVLFWGVVRALLLPLAAATAYSIFAFGDPPPMATSETPHFQALRQLNPAFISRIEIYRERIVAYQGTTLINVRMVTDPTAIARFAQSTSDVRARWPERGPTRTHKWRIVVVGLGSTRNEYRLMFAEGYPDRVIGRFVVDRDGSKSELGKFSSFALRGWIEAQLGDQLQ